MTRKAAVVMSLFFSSVLFAVDVPGGFVRNAESLTEDTYELMLSPTYMVSEGGAYLTSEVRYQPSPDFGVGFGFGAGELGYNFGAHGVWYVLPHYRLQPSIAVLGGLYFNRVGGQNFVVMKAAPTISEPFYFSWGMLTPYAAFQLAPSFELGLGSPNLTMKVAFGTELSLKEFAGLKVWLGGGIGLAKSHSDIVMGISYPFSAI